ncbi:DNA-binding SARP family transcriptional activator/ATP/maltotriose-dependent transcriptional regulator MalT [Allocatelliglobosispora scoriae]|uniref:DNA-binding SARP family transcriptional activator/ATP/maltotriose-dependent transcriptional regulator MalT n=1 Tax=Allocatelliglobosispora scoriae TaxID=643052 RepID=A0A841BHU3_9ACTN|nr:BTAD domain-containing putative transcriptional regulator [Allocatelliglobosispora scoriae]MBB5868677.1 DNA-binding SARP family transcriptional activator/ATP/maltotriose-dependent transcriptional regulator MalT [Allocatelliglobosispora scoriae]
MADQRIHLLVAAAGYGKTSALRRLPTSAQARWTTGAGAIELIGTEQHLVIDDLPALDVGQARRLLAALEALPDEASVAIASRHSLPVSPARLLGRGRLVELGPSELALTDDQTAELLAADYGLSDPDLADQLHEATAGWPALVRLGADLLTPGQGATLDLLTAPDGPVAGYIEHEILGELPPPTLALLNDVAELAPVTSALCEVIGHPAAGAVRALVKTGLLVRGPQGDRLAPAVARLAGHTATPPELLAAAAAHYERHGPMIAALRAYARAGLTVECGRIIDEHGDDLLAAGHANTLIEVLTAPGLKRRGRKRQLLLGDALRTGGSAMKAGQAYAVVADAEPSWDAGIAWRMGQLHYHRGESRAALKVFARAEESTEPSRDAALLLAWRSSAHLQLGETAAALEIALQATAVAVAADDDLALATAYVSTALCHNMAGNTADSEELFVQALAIAEQTGDIVVRSRVLTSQTYQLLLEARYPEALVAARQTGQCALAANHSNLRLIALINEGDALLMLGRYDEAIRQYERAAALSRRMGSRRTAAAQLGLGEVYRRRGWTEQARAAFESAIALAEEGGLNQFLVCALAGLARVLMAQDGPAAAAAAEKAGRLASDRVVVTALLARGWVALQAGEAEAATAFALEAAGVARAERDRAGLAESLELRAAAEPDARRARAALREAHAIWSAAGAVVAAAATRVAIGGLPDADTDDRLGALIAADTLVQAGVPIREARSQSPVSIKAFGRFEVCLHDQPVPPTVWQSRKARDLLRILVARRGRPVPRGELCELLWPDDDQSKTGHRLSVLLSIVRGVLDPDRSLPTDHFIVADQASIGLDVTRLHVDVEEFLADVGHGRRLRERGALAEAHRLLAVAVRSYRADVFEDEPYSEWSGALREEARAGYVSALRMLAQLGRKLGDTGAAVAHLMRLLTIDPYDEAGHRALIKTLVAGGQHGEAQRAQTRYREAMAAIGVQLSAAYQAPIQSP